MNTEQFKNKLDQNGYKYTENDGNITVNYQGDVDLYSLTTLPEGVKFENQGYVDLRSLTTLPAGVKFENQGGVYLRSLTTLPAGVKFENQGGVYLRSLTTLPEGTKFENQGGVDLRSLTTLPAGMKFENKGDVYLRSLTTLPEGTKFENQGYVDLYSLTTLPEGVKFENQGYVYLRSLTTLSEGTKFGNKGDVYLRSLTTEKQTYQGQEITLRNIDGYTMLIESEKMTRGITICKARYFGGGDLDKLKSCYLAKVGNHWAHGETAKEAIQDATDKAVIDMDQSEIVAEIKASDKVTLAQYRAITGACREGCRQFLQSIRKPDATELSLAEAKEFVKGHYGYDRFIEAINQ